MLDDASAQTEKCHGMGEEKGAEEKESRPRKGRALLSFLVQILILRVKAEKRESRKRTKRWHCCRSSDLQGLN